MRLKAAILSLCILAQPQAHNSELHPLVAIESLCEVDALAPGVELTIPRLPDLGELQRLVAEGPPTERLQKLSGFDSSTATRILFGLESGSASFRSFIKAFDSAGIAAADLNESERSYCISAISLHAAYQLQIGSFLSLEGLSSALKFFGVSDIAFSKDYLKVLDFWLQQLKGWDFYIPTSITVDPQRGSAAYYGRHERREFNELDSKLREEKLQTMVTNDYRQSIAELSKVPKQLLSPEVMHDFRNVREMLFALARMKQGAIPYRTAAPPTLAFVVERIAYSLRE